MSQLKYYNGTSWVPAVIGAQGVNGISGVQGIQGIQGSSSSNTYGWATIATGTVTSGNTITVSSISSTYANADFEFYTTGLTTSASQAMYLTINGDTGNNYAKLMNSSFGAPSTINATTTAFSNLPIIIRISGPTDGPKVFTSQAALGVINYNVYIGSGAVTSLTLTLNGGATFTAGTWYLRARP
jgi:hypothetical protein